jgi:orotidine-5'-phosphate decarboxylase
MRRNFTDLLEGCWDRGRHVCVGLDIDARQLPDAIKGSDSIDRLRKFAFAIVEATSDSVAAYKPNSSFFEALGPSGIELLRDVVNYVHQHAPSVPVIIDAKRADIASTNDGYVQAIYDHLQADAVTLHPYLGHEALRPFLDRPEKGCFILCRTSNPGAGELQDLRVDGEFLYLRVASLVARDWNTKRNCGLVAGATFPEELALIRARVPQLPLLIPGIGAQGGNVERTVRAAAIDGTLRAIINSSRGILYASNGADYADAAAEAARALHEEITQTVSNLRGDNANGC